MSTLFMFFGLFILWTEFSINRFDLVTIEAQTNKELKSTDFILSKNYNHIVDSLEKETNGIFLLFKPSKKYDIIFEDYDKNYERIITKKTIYFKKNMTFESIIFLLIATILLLISALLYFLSFYLLSRKKYLKYISEK